jgi:uncharacterized SAM-binding protein YcdF (DUF218 family)
MSGMKKFIRILFFSGGALFFLIVFWFLASLPLGFDRFCIRSQAPVTSEYIVCVAGGITSGELPTEDGWQRIYTAVQLYFDGWGKKIIFTGGGSGKMSEAEVYAEAAGWLGMAQEDAILDSGLEKALNIVTTPLHSKRTALCFAKAGFTNMRLVVAYRATGKLPTSRPDSTTYIRSEKKSKVADFKPSDKVYNDVFMRMKVRSAYFFTALRELAALAAYKLKGYI